MLILVMGNWMFNYISFCLNSLFLDNLNLVLDGHNTTVPILCLTQVLHVVMAELFMVWSIRVICYSVILPLPSVILASCIYLADMASTSTLARTMSESISTPKGGLVHANVTRDV